MVIDSKKTRPKRNQVSLRKEEYELAKKLAAEKGTSMSRVIGDALRATSENKSQVDPLADLIGIIKNADPNASECHDEVIYGSDLR